MTLKPGEMLFLYTDGVTEAMNPKQEQFTEARLLERLNATKEEDPRKMIEAVRDAVRLFAQDAPQSDDITMLALRYRAAFGRLRWRMGC